MSEDNHSRRRYPVGAEPQAGGGAHFRVWAPRRRTVAVVGEADGTVTALPAEGDGYFSGLVEVAGPGWGYRFLLDDDEGPYPDPASRFQPAGPHGPSQVVDPAAYDWSDQAWRGIALDEAVFYELHIGTFTTEGTWAAAQEHLPELAALGVTVLEVMPVADYPGQFGWGYDGVNLYAPCRLYGSPNDFRRFIDTAHRLGLAVILDVVYNHLGPDGNYLGCYSKSYVSATYENEWGDALNFDGPDGGPVREFFIANAAYWIDEYHLDGLRLDATQQIFDASPRHLVKDVADAVRAAAKGRATIIVGENEPQDIRVVREFGVDALWNDDFHHAAIVALTGRREAYYTDYLGKPQELISAAKHGFLYQGQWYLWQGKTRGTPSLGVAARHFVTFLENHDQIANSGRGERLHRQISVGHWRTATGLLLLMPGRPMLFQGQEFACSAPFLYFADHKADLARAVRKGRAEFLAQFPRLAVPELALHLPDPGDPATFAQCRLDHAERQANGWAVALHRDLLALRRDDPVLRAPAHVDGAVLADEAFVLRYFGTAAGDDRLLLVNFGRDLPMQPAPEPLLAPPEPGGWTLLWSSESAVYGGTGTPPPPRPGMVWGLPGRSAIVLTSRQDSAPHGRL